MEFLGTDENGNALLHAGYNDNGEPIIYRTASYTKITEDADGNPVAITIGNGRTKDGRKLCMDGMFDDLLDTKGEKGGK